MARGSGLPLDTRAAPKAPRHAALFLGRETGTYERVAERGHHINMLEQSNSKWILDGLERRAGWILVPTIRPRFKWMPRMTLFSGALVPPLLFAAIALALYEQLRKWEEARKRSIGGLPIQPDELTSSPVGEAFIGAESFSGARAGYVFKNGSKGIGYYLDSTSSASSEAGAAPPSGLAAVVPSTLLDALMSPAAAAGDEYVALRSAIHASAGAVGGLIYGNMHPGVAPRRAAAAGAAIGVTIALAEGSFAVRLMSWVSQPHGDAGEQATESTTSTSTDSQ